MSTMIDTADLQAFVEKIQGGTIPVDLLKIGQSHFAQNSGNSAGKKFNNNNQGKFRVAIDIEDCLDRFYGGYYSDWACGGQWNRAYQFVQILVNAFASAHIDLVVFFDGTLRENRKHTAEYNEYRQKTNSVLKHIRMIGTPPPKIWWLAPSGLKTCLRNALRSLNIPVVQTVYDHTMEIIDYFYESKLDGLLGLNADYIIANVSKYYSSHDLRLSYKGALETKEYVVSKLLTSLNLSTEQMPFVAVLLGGYTLIDETTLKAIHQKIEATSADFEARLRRIAEVVRSTPTSSADEFIQHLELSDWTKEIKDTLEYFQRKARFINTKKFLGGKRKNVIEIQRICDNTPSVPMASETNETDEIARKILDDVSNLVDDGDVSATPSGDAAATSQTTVASVTPSTSTATNESGKGSAKNVKANAFVYALPGEVLKTALNRHQRGIMDSRIYQLLTKKEIFLPQILEDEQYRDIPSIHVLYRPARQYIYAILFNLFHQKYLYSKTVGANASKDGKNRSKIVPEVQVSEWIWSPQNEYQKAEMVNAIQLPWAVPTIQRLWFGMAFEDKQRRMKAFLTVMRSDTQLMLNRTYVPQHMLVMACVLRYIVTSPDRRILTRPELDAFLATAFSPHLINVDYTQELVLPGVHLRGVYLATLFMQGVETASLANDACGVPLPWMMANPWLFFDGKLFHLKLKMSTYVQTLRDLCENQIDVVVKIERFRKAILEDVEHLLLPAHMEPLYRNQTGYIQAPIQQQYGKNALQAMQNVTALANGSSIGGFYSTLPHQQTLTTQAYAQTQANASSYYGTLPNTRNVSNYRGRYNSQPNHPSVPQQSHQIHHSPHLANRHQLNRQSGYQLKVGGVVVGSWAGSAPNRNQLNAGSNVRINRNNMTAVGNTPFIRHPLNPRARTALNTRLQRNVGHQHVTSLSRTISRNTYGNKMQRNRSRKNRKERKGTTTEEDATKQKSSEDDSETDENKTDEVAAQDAENANGTANQASTLAKSMCHNILNEEEDDIGAIRLESDEASENIIAKMSSFTINDESTKAKNVNGNSVEKTNGDSDDKAGNDNNNSVAESDTKITKKGNINNNDETDGNSEIVAVEIGAESTE